MDLLTNDYPNIFLTAQEPPCLSLYQPTHRHYPENQQDPIRFRNLVKTIEDSLRQKYQARDFEPILSPFRLLAGNKEFWNHTLDGLAVLASAVGFRVYRLQRPVPELAIVANSFHTKPLHRILQSADRYQVLGLNRREIRLFEGNRDVLDEIEPAPGVPRTIVEALGEELTDPHLTVASYGGATGTPMHHGHGSKKDEVDIDVQRFFRAVDRAVLENHSRRSGLPLVLAALPEYHSIFRQISHNPFLLADAIDTFPDTLSADELRKRAWNAVEPQYHARLAGLVDKFMETKSRGLGSDELEQVAAAAVARRVDRLLIDADRHIAGRIDLETGQIDLDNPANPEADDLLDDLGELVLRTGGQIVIVPKERMPTGTGVAAIYRF